MKLIIVGATGFVGKELLRQSLQRSDITSVVAVSRRALPPGTSAKLRSVIVKDYDQYTEEAKKEFAGANACIWTIAITPSKSSAVPWDEVVRVCQTSALVGLRAIYESGVAKPFRHIYMSGVAAERDQSKTPSFKPKYSLMRGETESQVLAFANEHPGEIEATVAKPGLITEPWNIPKRAFATVLGWTVSLPSIYVGQIATAMLDQVVNGIEKDPLLNVDLVRIADDLARTS
ncbi:hypothetical protein BDV95DRAFT_607656 [Massariosphaeria phaeospora]|uniref:NAD(P)-binding domain-containing protein n=1 Tax=Massariosphaeria phaeospora TaxID=100035 RepID=A0A7C8I6G1_9PLEO|nr:hypothetical protein BDV95DRAFT_607656 [Massariosphaeria phaeospora]